VLIRQAESKREEKKLAKEEALRRLMDEENRNLGTEVVPEFDDANDSDSEEELGSWS
jgi:hypothetical protein